jgi:hypothetical protein
VVEIISLSSTTYEEILESMGSVNYLLEMIYLYSQSIDQITEPLQFVKYDANGNIAYQITVPTIDPNQYQNSLYIKIDGKDYVFNGRTFVAFTINASQTLFMYFGTLSFGNKDFLPKEFLFESFTDRICQ